MAVRKKAHEIDWQAGKRPKEPAAKPKGSIRPQAVAKLEGAKLARPVRERLPPAVAKSAQEPLMPLPAGYAELLRDLKQRIGRAQVRAAVAASRELVRLYWDIGREIVQRQKQEGWGKGVVDCLAADIQRAFPGIGGFSAPQRVADASLLCGLYPGSGNLLPQPAADLDGRVNLPQVAAEIPWFHNVDPD